MKQTSNTAKIKIDTGAIQHLVRPTSAPVIYSLEFQSVGRKLSMKVTETTTVTVTAAARMMESNSPQRRY